MRILFILIFAMFSLGAMATLDVSDQTPGASGSKVADTRTGTLTGAVAAVRKIKSHLSVDQLTQTSSGPEIDDQDNPRLKIGEMLPEEAELHVVPRHESYRYAIVQGQRVIVDAGSRQIVYIIR